MDGVKVFHARAAVTQNARSPIVECTVRGTMSSDVDAERVSAIYSVHIARRPTLQLSSNNKWYWWGVDDSRRQADLLHWSEVGSDLALFCMQQMNCVINTV